MERMDMESRNQYLKILREKYLNAKAKKENVQILDKYCRNTGQARKYVIRNIQPGVELSPKLKKRKQIYDGQVTAALAEVWEMFNCPCGQRLKPILEVELDRLMVLGKLKVSDEAALKLKMMSSATIDRKLEHQREVLRLLRSRGDPEPSWYSTKRGVMNIHHTPDLRRCLYRD